MTDKREREHSTIGSLEIMIQVLNLTFLLYLRPSGKIISGVDRTVSFKSGFNAIMANVSLILN